MESAEDPETVRGEGAEGRERAGVSVAAVSSPGLAPLLLAGREVVFRIPSSLNRTTLFRDRELLHRIFGGNGGPLTMQAVRVGGRWF